MFHLWNTGQKWVNIYVEGVINSLQQSDLCCHIRAVYVGCVAYADDSIVLSASVLQLQAVINVCNKCGVVMTSTFSLMLLSSVCSQLVRISRRNWLLRTLEIIVYAGHTRWKTWMFMSSLLNVWKVDISVRMHRFYASSDAIYSHTKFVSEIPRLFIWSILFQFVTFCRMYAGTRVGRFKSVEVI